MTLSYTMGCRLRMNARRIHSKDHLKMAKKLRKLAAKGGEEHFHVLSSHLNALANEFEAVGYGRAVHSASVTELVKS